MPNGELTMAGWLEKEAAKPPKPKTFREWWRKETTELPLALKAAARGLVKGVTLGYVEPEALKPKTKEEEELVKYVATVGEMTGWFLPFAGITKGLGLAIRGATAIPKIARIAVRVVPRAPAVVREIPKLAVPFATYEALAKPEEGETREEAAMKGALMGAMFPVIGAALKPIAKPVVKEIGRAHV